jgi:hypothetical protein
MFKTFLRILVIVVAFVFLVRTAWAIELEISGNAADSQNTIQIQQGGSTNVNQSNQMDVTNNVDAQANTGGNTVGGGGSVTTGDASVFVKIKNFFNINRAETECCPEPSDAPFDPGKPTPTPDPGSPPTGGGPPAGGAGGGNGGGGGGNGGGGVGGGEVLGLAGTAGDGITETAIQLLGLVCLGIGSALVGPKKLFS